MKNYPASPWQLISPPTVPGPRVSKAQDIKDFPHIWLWIFDYFMGKDLVRLIARWVFWDNLVSWTIWYRQVRVWNVWLCFVWYRSYTIHFQQCQIFWCQIVPVPICMLLHYGVNLSRCRIIPEKKMFCNMMPVDRIKTNWLGRCRVGGGWR